MIEKSPSRRKAAEIYLAQARGNVFPEYFYSFLQSYMQIFSAAPILSPDEKIGILKKDIGNITNMFGREREDERREEEEEVREESGSEVEKVKSDEGVDSSKADSAANEEESGDVVNESESHKDQILEKIELDVKNSPLDTLDSPAHESAEKDDTTRNDDGAPKTADVEEGLVIVTQLVTSCIRGLHHSQSKLQSLEILLELAEHTQDETILDRILPYIVSFSRKNLLLGSNSKRLLSRRSFTWCTIQHPG